VVYRTAGLVSRTWRGRRMRGVIWLAISQAHWDVRTWENLLLAVVAVHRPLLPDSIAFHERSQQAY